MKTRYQFALFLLLLASLPAHARCGSIPTVCAAYDSTPLIFRGRVLQITPIPPEPPTVVTRPDGTRSEIYSLSPGGPEDQVRLQVLEVFKGDSGPEITLVGRDQIFILDGATTPLGAFTGIRSSAAVSQALVQVTNSLRSLTPQRGGWQYLLTSSKNYAAAKLLALQPYECDATTPPPPIPAGLQPLSVTLANAYLAQSPSLAASGDPDLLGTPILRIGPLNVAQNANCGYWGYDRFVFAALASTYESPKSIGQIFVVMALRKGNAQWRLLAISSALLPNSAFLNQTNITPLLLGPPDSSLPSSNQSAPAPPDEAAPAPAQILSPPDTQVPAPAAGQRFGFFTWQPSPSPNFAFEVAEFANPNDTRLYLMVPAAPVPVDPTSPSFTGAPPAPPPAQLSAGLLNTTRSTWTWRIWSVSTSGLVTFSTSHTFPH